MGFLDHGRWRRHYDYTNDDGEFDRQESSFRDRIRDEPDARYQPEAGRYHLYVSYACPWAHRTLLARALLGLEDAITVDVVNPYRHTEGWSFAPEREGCTPDTVNGADRLREVYAEADPEYVGRVTVPTLWDREHETIVNNESKEILRMLSTQFGDVATNDVDLYPEGYRDEVDRIVEAIYDPINNGVYRAGFAKSQAAYEDAVDELFDALDHWNEVLADQRYLAGDVLTEADVCMFTTLIRFDKVYNTHFNCNRKRILDYEHLQGYLRELYQLPGVADTVNMEHITEHYYRSHTDLNPPQIVPVGPELGLDADHGRHDLPGGPPADLA